MSKPTQSVVHLALHLWVPVNGKLGKDAIETAMLRLAHLLEGKKLDPVEYLAGEPFYGCEVHIPRVANLDEDGEPDQYLDDERGGELEDVDAGLHYRLACLKLGFPDPADK